MKLDKEKAIRELGISLEIYEELINCFVDQTEGALKKLEDSFREENWSEIARLGHFVKGSAANIQIHEMEEVSRGIEDVRNGVESKEKLGEDIARLNQLFGELKEIVRGGS